MYEVGDGDVVIYNFVFNPIYALPIGILAAATFVLSNASCVSYYPTPGLCTSALSFSRRGALPIVARGLNRSPVALNLSGEYPAGPGPEAPCLCSSFYGSVIQRWIRRRGERTYISLQMVLRASQLYCLSVAFMGLTFTC